MSKSEIADRTDGPTVKICRSWWNFRERSSEHSKLTSDFGGKPEAKTKWWNFGGSDQERRWIWSYLALAWMAETGNGVINTITGPVQPYLAYNLNTSTSTINLVWTLGFTGFLLGSLLTSLIFKKHLHSDAKKQAFLCVVLVLTGISTIMLPLQSSLYTLLLTRFIQFLCYGIFVTADSTILVMALGPKASRPLINALHFFISIGFLLGTILVQPFLPRNREKVCRQSQSLNATLANSDGIDSFNSTSSGQEAEAEAEDQDIIPIQFGLQSIAWPFIISGVWCLFISLGFVWLAFSGLKMPHFYSNSSGKDDNANCTIKEQEENGAKSHQTKLSKTRKYMFILLTLLFFCLSGAIVRVFQSMSMTFALCGPLKLNSHRAALTDSFYSCGMCLGRLASIVLATRLLPSTIVLTSTLCCLLAAFQLVLFSPHWVWSLYIGVAVMGFFVSWQFGAGYSWTSHLMNITGKLSSVFFIGLGVGSLSSPPLVGYLFQHDTMAYTYLVTGMLAIQVVCSFVMACTARESSHTSSSQKA